MKKYFKLQAKKSLSLLMAVVMLMTCWVWIAPEAEAVNEATEATNGSYYVQVFGNLSDYSNKTNLEKNNWIVTYKTNNGTGSESTINLSYVFDVYNGGANANDVILAAGWVPGFPIKVRNEAKVGCGGDAFSYQPRKLYIGSEASTTSVLPNEVASYGDQYSTTLGEDIGYDIFTVDPEGTYKPVAKSVRNVSSVSSAQTVPAIGSGSKLTVSHTLGGQVYDQYGVRLLNIVPDSYYLGDHAGTTYTLDGHGIGIENSKIVINEKAQTIVTSKKAYIIGKYGSLESDSDNSGIINLTFPSYTMTVNPAGSTGATATMEMTDGTNISTQTTNWVLSGAYGTEATGKWPNGNATMEGYTFKGFWTALQPSDQNEAASFFAYESDFATPVSSDDFVKVYGGTEDGDYVEKDGKKYYNAGTKWDPANRKVQGPVTFYGWWISTDITANFYDINGKYLGSKVFKYGMTPAATEYPDPLEEYNDAGAFTYNVFSGVWQDISGVKVTEGSYKFGSGGLTELYLTPTYVNKEYKSEYTVKFINPVTGSALREDTYNYRDLISESERPSAVTMPDALGEAVDYSYAFKGWTSEVPANGKYHTVDKENPAVAVNEDWRVRDDAVYYPIFERTVKQYRVSFTYIDSTGTEVTKTEDFDYGSVIRTPDYINRTYAKEGKGYNLLNWNYNGAEKFAVDGILVLNEGNVTVEHDRYVGSGNEAVIPFVAVYDEGVDMPYTITFKYKGSKGEDLSFVAEVNHGQKITQEIVDQLPIPTEYDDGEYLYKPANRWKVTEGVAEHSTYTRATLTSLAPVSNVTFEAVYNAGIPFRTVIYNDGKTTHTERITAGSNIPAWLIDSGEVDANGDPIMKEYVPADYKSTTGIYKFAGWFDEPQTDKNYAATNGTQYTTQDTVINDLTLYAQYKFEAFKFTIKFMDYTGKVQLAIAQVEAGQSFEAAFIEAQRAAQYRAPDETYEYTFIGWDNKVPDNFLCEGKDVTYTAQYKPGYVYYKANWYNSKDEMEAATGNEKVGEGGLLAITNHTYNGTVYSPAASFDAPEGKVFAGWKYLKDGVETDYQRGMKITSAMSFYATYKDAPVVYTISAVVDGVTTVYEVGSGDNATVVGTPVDGYDSATHHKKFAGWYTDANYAEDTEFDVNAEVTGSVTIYAKFETEAHKKDQKELISAPTYYAKGSEKVWCACSRANTEETREIATLTDTVAPTGVIYLGTQGKWSSTDTVGAAATDGDEVTLYANADTDIILTINDTGDVNAAYNPSGEGKGIKMIRGFISTGVYTQDNQTGAVSEVVTIYEDNTEDLNNVANYVIRLGEYTGLVDGETYIAYYYAIDKAGNVLNKNVRTAKFIYDITAPEFDVTGESNAATATSTVTYCGKATVTGIEDGAAVTVNGAVVTATDGNYVIDTAGNYIITVTDKAGNSYSKKIIVADGHTNITTEQPSTCTTDGFKKVECSVCGKISENKTYTAPGHEWTISFVPADCENNGYNLKVCDVCGAKETSETYVDPEDGVEKLIQPKLGHDYAKDTEGNIIYTVITKATCKTVGKQIANCTRCGKGTIEAEIPVDTENGHVYGGIKTEKATCTEDGRQYQTCKYCFVEKLIKTLPATGHEESYATVTTQPTCYSEGVKTFKCKKCDVVTGTEPVAKIAHTLVLVKYDTDADKSTEYPNGYMQYECQATGCTHTEGKTAIAAKATYTVTFKGAGENGADLVITKQEGESVAATEVVDQTKASDNTYNYTFAGWKGTDGKVVKLPVTVTANATYTAEFTSTKIIYTHKFFVPTKWTTTLATDGSSNIEFAEIMGAYGDTNKKPVAIPVFSDADANTDADLKSIYTFKFLGWSTTGAAGDIVDEFTMTKDASFYAVFEAVPIEFSVIFYDENRTTVLWNTNVNGGEDIAYGKKDAEDKLVTPVKDADADKHYTFAGWIYGEDSLELGEEFGPITETTRIYATYTGTAHSFVTVNDADKTWAATCTKEGQKTEKCSVCDYEKVTTIPKAEHEYELQPDGSQVCKICGDTIAPEAKIVTVTFNESVSYGTGIPTIAELKSYEVAEGNTKSYTAPEKVKTNEYEFKFVCWVDGEGEEVTKEATITVTAGEADATYTAVYEATTRKYNVTYIDLDYNVLKTESVEYGDTVPAAPEKAPEEDATAYVHYVHTGWTVEAGTKVYSDITIKPVYTGVEHDWDNVNSEATCTTTGGEKQICKTCGYVKESPDVKPALGHDWSAPVRVEPTYNAAGSITKTCKRCGEVEITPLVQLTYKKLEVTVTKNGAIAIDAKVVVYLEGVAKATNFTNNSGKVTFEGLVEGTYTIQIVYGSDSKTVDNVSVYSDTVLPVELNEAGSGSGTPSCSCSCHRNGFWGIVFRFFHKIIKFFTGKINCCSNPDSRY